MDLLPPQGDGADDTGDNVKLESEPRGFFADQFEVRGPFSLPPCALSGSRGFTVVLVYVPGMENAHDPVTASVFNDQKGRIKLAIDSFSDHMPCSRFLPPADGLYVQECAVS